MAPEVMNSGKKVVCGLDGNDQISYHGYGHAVDWWSLGVITYSMNFLRKPFEQPSLKSDCDEQNDKEKFLSQAHANMER